MSSIHIVFCSGFPATNEALKMAFIHLVSTTSLAITRHNDLYKSIGGYVRRCYSSFLLICFMGHKME
jgi:hypothetical protein